MLVSRSSALDTALRRTGDRWGFLIVDALQAGSLRFSELAEAVPGIATNVLSQRLRQLEASSIIVATPYSQRPVRYQYALTESGRGLADPLQLLAQWGTEQSVVVTGSPEPIEHVACGTALQVRWFCPTCAQLVEADEELWEV